MNFQYIYAIVQLVDSDLPANILAGLQFQAQESQAISPDGVCAISTSLAGHDETIPYGGHVSISSKHG